MDQSQVAGESKYPSSDLSLSLADIILEIVRKRRFVALFSLLGLGCAGIYLSILPEPIVVAEYHMDPIQMDGKVQASFSNSHRIFDSMLFSEKFSNELVGQLEKVTIDHPELSSKRTTSLRHLALYFGVDHVVQPEKSIEVAKSLALEYYRARTANLYKPAVRFDFTNINFSKLEVRTRHIDDVSTLIVSAVEAYNLTVLEYNEHLQKSWEKRRAVALEEAAERFNREYSDYERSVSSFDQRKVGLLVDLAHLSSAVEGVDKQSGSTPESDLDKIGVYLNSESSSGSDFKARNFGNSDSGVSLLVQDIRLDRVTNRIGRLLEVGAINKESSDKFTQGVYDIISGRRQLKTLYFTHEFEANEAFRRFRLSLETLPVNSEMEASLAAQARVSLSTLRHLENSGLLLFNSGGKSASTVLLIGGVFGLVLGMLSIFLYSVYWRLSLYGNNEKTSKAN